MRNIISKILFTLLVLTMGIGSVWGTNGDVLFTQNFGSVTALPYRYTSGTVTETYSYSSSGTTLTGLVGTGANLFTSFESSVKKGDIAINSTTGGNNVDATGIFRVYSNGDNATQYSLVRSANFATTAPTAVKVTFDIKFKNISSGSNAGVSFAIGSGFSDNSLSLEAAANVHSGFSIIQGSTPYLSVYGSNTKFSGNPSITSDTWMSIVWVINNTGSKLTYSNPTGSGETELNNDCFDIWLKETSAAATTYTRIVTNQSASTPAKDLQNIFIGNAEKKKHELSLDNIVVTDLTPAAATNYTITYDANGGSGEMANSTNTVSACTFTAPTNKEFKEWNTQADGNGTTVAVGATVTANTDLYAIWKDQTVKYAVTYNLGGASGDAPTEANKAAGDEFNLADAPSWSGHVFQGWLCNIDSEVKAAGASYTMTAAATTFTAQWKLENDATFGNGMYVLGSSALNVASLFSSTCTGDVTFALKAASEHAEITTAGAFTADAIGDYVVVATQVADATYAGVAKEATITVQLNPLGTGHVLTWTMKVGGNSNVSTLLASAASTSTYVTAGGTLNKGTSSVIESSAKPKSDRTIKVTGDNVGTTRGENSYIEFPFTITDGYQFTPTAASVKVANITTAKKYDLVILNADGSESVARATFESTGTDGSVETITWSSISGITLTGSGKLRVYAYYAEGTDGHRFGTPITITGTVAEAGATPSGYTVTYAGDKDGGSFPVDADVYASGAEVTVKDKPEGLTRTILGAPATFLGWSTNENMYGGTHYKAGDKFTITANTTLYAIWGFNITYIDEDKSTEITGLEPTYYIYGEGATLPTNPTAPTGYTFGGWYNAWCVDESSTSSSPCGENAPCGFDDTHCLTTEIGTTDTWDAEYYAKWILSAPTYEVTFNMNDHGTAPTKQDVVENGKVTKPADPTAIGYEFGGWYKEAGCANAWDFNTDVITEATVLYAKWTAFTGCTELWPATSGDAPTAEGDEINMQTGSTGATMTVLAKANKLAYTSAGLQFGSESGVKVNVVLNNEIVVGTRISMTLVAGGEKTRGLFLYDANGNKINAFTCWVDGTNAASNGAEETFTYTVVANDGLAGTNEFQLWRNNTVYLKSLKVSNCGDAIIYHNLTSEVNIAGKGTVTLGASSVREGLTTTAEYSAIDEAYEFVNWTVSGEGASIADATANPATITMGTGDAVVTLNLQLKPVYYTVTYKDGESSMGTEEVAENGHPTATGITTAKKGYNFLGWSETNGGAVVELSTITITAATNIYAKYEAIPCPTYGTVFSMNVTDPADTEYNENNEFSLEIGATYTGGKAYSGSKDSNKRKGKIDANGEYSFNANGDVTVKVDLDCSLQEGDVLSFTSTPSRELKIQKVAGTDLYTTSGKTFTIPAASPLIGEYEFYLMRDNSQSTFKTFNIYRPAVLTGVTLDDAVVAIGGIVTPTMTLAPVADAYVSSQVWSIEGAGEGTIANIDPSTGEVTGVAIGSVTVKVVLNGSIENTCTVTVIESYTQLDVTETSEWNFAGAAAASSKKSFPNNTEEFLLANISGVNNTPEFNARALVIKGKYVSNSQLQAQTIRFNVATSGKLTIRYACTSDKGDGNDRELYINGVATGSMTSNGEVTYTQVVPGGEVTIKALYDKESVLTEDIMNYKYIKFDVNPDVSDADYIRTTTEGRYGTICLPYDGVMVGATIYEAAYRDLGVQKIFFDEVINGEMEAGKPYLFLPKEGATQLGVYYTSSAAPVAATHYNGFHGYYDLGHLTDGETAYPYNVAVGEYLVYNNQYVMVNGTNSYLAQFRAYIVMSEMPTQGVAPAPGRRRVGMGYTGTNTATGVEDVQGDNVQCTKVIIDGQLYIIRGEKMYNANGLLVK